MSQRTPTFRRIGKNEDDVDPLFLDPERRHLGCSEGLDAPHDCVEILSTPAGDNRSLAWPDPDRISREEIDDNLQIRGSPISSSGVPASTTPSLRRMTCSTTPLTGAITGMHLQSSRRLRISCRDRRRDCA